MGRVEIRNVDMLLMPVLTRRRMMLCSTRRPFVKGQTTKASGLTGCHADGGLPWLCIAFVLICAQPTVGADATSSEQPLAQTPTGDQNPLSGIKHFIIIYQENWSFDSLYGNVPAPMGSPMRAITSHR
jgi:phospholipase C